MTLFSQTRRAHNAYWIDLAFNEWFQPDYIQAYDGNGAFSVIEPSNLVTDILLGNNYQFLIPNNASISGIVLTLYKKGLDAGGTEIEVFDNTVQLYFGGASGDNKADTPTAWNKYIYSAKTYGANNDTWSIPGITPSDINSSGFGFGLIAEGIGGGTLGHAQVDYSTITVYYTVGPESGTFPLYIYGHIPESGNIPLFIEGQTLNSGVIPLFLQSNPSGAFPIYLLGHIGDSGTFPLFMDSFGISSGIFPLFVQVNEIQTTSGIFPLNIFGNSTGASGLFTSFPLYLESENFPGQIPLFIQVDNMGTFTGEIPLYLSGDPSYSFNYIPLFLCQSGVSNSIPLFIEGKSTSLFLDPSFPNAGTNATGFMPLYIQRNEAELFPLFLSCNLQSSGNFPLYTFGMGLSSGNIPLFLETGANLSTNSLKLFVRGRA